MKKIKILLSITVVIVLLIFPKRLEAAVQASGNEGATKNLDTWIVEIRKMEQSGGALGLE